MATILPLRVWFFVLPALFLITPPVLPGGLFLRGDSNGDGALDIADGINVLGYLFLGASTPPCLEAADANDDGTLDIADGVFVLNYLFTGGQEPPAPGPRVPGLDPTPDGLGCGPALETSPYEPPEEPPASPSTTKKVTVRGWDPRKKEAIAGRALEIEALRIPGRGMDFSWVMTYRSRSGADTPQGNGWDFSYDVWIERPGGSRSGPLLLHDGTGRADSFSQLPDGTYAARGFFLEGREGAGGGFTFTFPDGGSWIFHPLDGTPVAGRLETIRDHNGNAIQFDHIYQHNQTDLEFLRIHDTLDREITAAFGPGGPIQTLTDFTGRRVTFEHYQDGEAGGSAGDLKSVTTPPFTAGNDPPEARTTTFTYSKGFADPRLNHNLLTVTDPRGRRSLTLVYSPSLDPADPSFDRAVSRVEGEGTARRGLARVFYGGPSEPFRVVAVDLAGNVEESSYDAKNRLVRLREFTGRSDPAIPVTDSQNRPQGKLRPGDPEFFESTCEWNDDSLVTRRVFPEKNGVEYVYQADLDPGAPPRQRANLREVRRRPGPGGAAEDAIVELFEYEPVWNRITRAVDGLGQEARFQYDERGNLLRSIDRIPSSVHDYEHNGFGQLTAQVWPDNGSGQRRREEYEYHTTADGPQNGYLKTVRLRLTPLDSEMGFETDLVGNVVQFTDPRGNVWRYEYNPLDELVRVTSPVGSGVPQQVVWDTFHDLAGNTVREDVLNLNASGVIDANAAISTVYEYDALNRLVRKHQESGNAQLGPGAVDGSTLPLSEFITTEYQYDAAGKLSLLRPVALSEEPVNVLRLEYDERGFLFRRTQGAGSTQASTDQYDYDQNGNRVLLTAGLEGPPGPTLRVSYDGFDRPVRAEDAAGNAEVLERDANGRVVVRFKLADSTGDPADVKVRLEETRYEYDPMDRRLSLQRLTEPGNPASGRVTTGYTWSDSSELTQVLDPNGNPTRYGYDGAGRLQAIQDGLGNSSTFEYDASSNLVRRADAELTPGSVSQLETRYEYDPLGRRIRATDGLGASVTYGYDSRSNLTEVLNALGGATHYQYDGAGRLQSARRGLADGEIVTRFNWDASSRMVEEIDSNQNAIRHAYDALDRRISTTFADGTVHEAGCDLRGNPIRTTDANGTVVDLAYDALDRLTRKDITPGPGVSGATSFEEFRYDGLSRLLGARNDRSTATFSYDALSRVTRETLDQRTTVSSYDAAGNLLSLSYPGGTALSYLYDGLGRALSVGDGANCCSIVKSTGYLGLRPLSRALANGVDSSWTYDAVRRPTRALHQRGTPPVPLSDRRHGWDAMYRQVSRGDQLPGGLSQEFGYDPAHRLVQSVLTLPGTPPRATSYLLDPAGNRNEVQGAFDPGRYLRDATLPEPADFQVDQYTSTPFDQRAYDRNGNLLRFGRPLPGKVVEVACSFDYVGRLVEIADPATGESLSFSYDALGRLSSSSSSGIVAAFSYHGGEIIEDSRGIVRIYLGGQPVAIRSGGQPFFLLQDGLGNTTALADSGGNLVERYEYGDFGQPRILDPAGNPASSSKVGNPFLLADLEYDAASGLYHSRAVGVHFDPRAARPVNGSQKVKSGFIRSSPAQLAGIPGHADLDDGSDFVLARRGSSTRSSDGLVFNVVNPRAARHVWTVLPAGVLETGGDLGGGSGSYFREVTGLDIYVDSVEVQEGGKNDSVHKRPGPTRFSPIVLERGLARYEGPRFDAGSWGIIKWEGPELDASKNEVSVETIEIAHQGLTGRPLRGRVPVAFTITDPEARGRAGSGAGEGSGRAYFEVPRPKKPLEDRSRTSDNGWGSCFNCHPFGLAGQVHGGDPQSRRRFQTLSNASKARHDATLAAIQNTR
jgi:YD repeat-containing protein